MDYLPFRVVITDKQSVLFDQQVWALTSQNAAGEFDILAEHVSFVTHITGPIKLLMPDKSEKSFTAKAGFIHVHEQVAKIYISE